MGSDWTEVSLSELTTKITKGTTPTKKDGGFSSEGVNYIKSEAVTFDGRIDESKFTFISSEIHKKLKRSQLEESDILMSMAGIHLGKTAIVRTRHLPANTNQALALIRPIRNKIYPDYLFYFLQQSSVVYFINNSTSQSAQPNINLQEIGSLNIKYPEYNEQKAIAHILGSLDDKIELNRQMNETLEAMAQALFKSWFVDFDPVIDNALAAGNAIPDEFIERAEQRKGIEKKDDLDIQKLFPDEFEFTEGMGWIPKGWEVKPLDEVANYLNGLALQKFRPENIDDDYLPVVKIAQLREGLPSHDEKASINIKPEYIIDNGDVIFSWSGSLLVDIWCGGEAALNQHLFKVTSDKYPKWFYLNYTKHHLTEFQRIATDKAVTMGHIKRGHLKEALCLIPKNGVDDNVFAVFEDILSKQISSRIESQTLAKLRDTLLPKLMSGELRIPDATTILEDV